mmetsp:Transcript_32674/g.45576  ORF Transcript_32674/g.45576 Transcript_32674/m.45576 type:complete len:153 (-) Transcript_32674:304-762(-)|eukprot:CAMPEP_0185255772 /NCGR_PEP_ID=MMETSP1359-20130426/4843_1 /TAXON_ID=552665 /ORGANISM="Bigelowiella longifila, Strain CCMP242" /LENGTH=152 /DNA_ID=CAMNT_0027839933 /DNA_START=152 /DNA_END=610 /DNA_ORIENTATION=+
MNLGDILAALKAQSSKKNELKGVKLEKPPLDEETKKNAQFLLCSQCNCKIIKPNKATLIEDRKIFMHHMSLREEDQKQSGQELTKFWLVSDQFQFENIGVSKPTGESADFRYLACSDCDLGPIGIRFNVKPAEFLIAHDRVHYYTPATSSGK